MRHVAVFQVTGPDAGFTGSLWNFPVLCGSVVQIVCSMFCRRHCWVNYI